MGFSIAPSSLYGLYEQREHLSSLTITLVYAVYAVGILASLLLAGHVSDWYGRRVVLVLAITVAIVAAILFLTWMSLAGLLVARVLAAPELRAVHLALAEGTDPTLDPDRRAWHLAATQAIIAPTRSWTPPPATPAKTPQGSARMPLRQQRAIAEMPGVAASTSNRPRPTDAERRLIPGRSPAIRSPRRGCRPSIHR